LKKGIEISPGSIQLWTNLALSYINIKDYKKAISVLESLPEKERKENNEVLSMLKGAYDGLQRNGNSSETTRE
jgi:lipopolysaccharide biosynthesis regulator YciM